MNGVKELSIEVIVSNYFEQLESVIASRSQTASIMFEWYVYSIFKDIRGYESIVPNFIIDEKGNPKGHARPGVEDVFIKYNDFSLLLECSLRSGTDQLDYESESVVRHLSNFLEKNDKEAYLLFLSPTINLDFTKYVSIEKEKHKIVPLTIKQLKVLIEVLIESNDLDKELHVHLNNLHIYNLHSKSEEEYLKEISNYFKTLAK